MLHINMPPVLLTDLINMFCTYCLVSDLSLSSSSHRSTAVNLSFQCLFFCVCVFARMSVSAFVCEQHSVWHDKRWPSLCVLHPIPVMACRTQVLCCHGDSGDWQLLCPSKTDLFEMLSSIIWAISLGSLRVRLGTVCYSTFPYLCMVVFNLYTRMHFFFSCSFSF